MKKNCVVVGGGISGLTAAAYLVKNGNRVILLEKSENLGGLVGSFERDGFVFDGGIRAIENSGTVFPMLKDLGIEIPFIKNHVSLGIEDQMVRLSDISGLDGYRDLLSNIFPDEQADIDEIVLQIKKISKYMDILYGIDNPLFLDYKRDRSYLLKTILPWVFKYMYTVKKVQKLTKPVNDYLKGITHNSSLIDMITQHFFSDTPTFFALSYFRLYTDYYYPQGGTGTLIEALKEFILDNGGRMELGREVVRVDVSEKTVHCSNQEEFTYDKLLWSADLKSLYRFAAVKNASDMDGETYEENKRKILNGKGNESIFTIYVETDLSPEYYLDKCSEHTFYTPDKIGLSSMEISLMELVSKTSKMETAEKKERYFAAIKEFARKTTYEISIPVLRDRSLAPEGKSGLIISTVFDYSLSEYFYENGLYEEFKETLSEEIIQVFSESLFPGFDENILSRFSATPVTIKQRLNNTGGAITGWSFSSPIPVENHLIKIAKSVDTPFKDVYQSGHWVFSPSGLPTGIITAKLAADKIVKR